MTLSIMGFSLGFHYGSGAYKRRSSGIPFVFGREKDLEKDGQSPQADLVAGSIAKETPEESLRQVFIEIAQAYPHGGMQMRLTLRYLQAILDLALARQRLSDGAWPWGREYREKLAAYREAEERCKVLKELCYAIVGGTTGH